MPEECTAARSDGAAASRLRAGRTLSGRQRRWRGRCLFGAPTRGAALSCRMAFDVASDSHSIVLDAEDLVLKNHEMQVRLRQLLAATAKMRPVVGAPAAFSAA